MALEEQVQLEHFVSQLASAFREAWKTSSEYELAAQSGAYEARIYDEQLVDEINAIYVRLCFAFELLRLPQLRSDLTEGFKAYQKDVTRMAYTSWGEGHPPALSYLQTFLQPLRDCVKSDRQAESLDGLAQLERILIGTPKVVRDRRVKPSNEKEVRQCMYELLLHVFPDTVREIPIAKVSKSYKPDIGVRSLRAAVEYKFADSEKEAKVAIGGIYEDVSGYAGSDDWKTFFAVIYMTDAFFTQAQVEAEFKSSNVNATWRPLVVLGKGGRK